LFAGCLYPELLGLFRLPLCTSRVWVDVGQVLSRSPRPAKRPTLASWRCYFLRAACSKALVISAAKRIASSGQARKSPPCLSMPPQKKSAGLSQSSTHSE
jgi:hypothetical protein